MKDKRGDHKEFHFNTIDEAVNEIRYGRMIIVVDDEDRENEGDLVMAAGKVTPEAINFMARHGRGLICLPLTGERLDELRLPLMVNQSTDAMNTAFAVSIDAKDGIATGISAADRAETIRIAVDPRSKPEDLATPGHVFPLRAKSGGVLRRAGHTEAAVDLARLAGLYPAGVICEILKDDGTMARVPELTSFAAEHGLAIITIADLISYRRRSEKLIRRIAEAEMPTQSGAFRVIAYESILEDGACHVALVKGDVTTPDPVTVRVHSECLTGDVFGSLRCDCGPQLQTAVQMVEQAGRGVVLYMRQEGRGIGLTNKLKAYALQDLGKDTVEANLALGFPADLRDYGVGAQILFDLGVREIRLITNNPRKIKGLQGYGLKVVERIPLQITPHHVNERYLRVKKEKLGHLLD
ncbi:MAG: bifunctional 3,4-dihydroxy-2-butanone-4-phosphate synthase/GTP cyclohydrolase II [Firmicutes bacterium]|nr:bifunctional 3,4-dihydroxy-2-butanone-4-phosphate synthase/GTP cyclohydrolase II [Bacillota bacterium]